VNTLQSVRNHLKTTDATTQKAFLGTVDKIYHHLAGLLIDTGRLAEAQQVLAMLKEDEYHDFIRRDAGDDPRATRASFTGREIASDAKLQTASRPQSQFGAEAARLREKKEQGALSAAESERLAALEAELDAANLTFNQTIDEIKVVFARVDDTARRDEGLRKLVEYGLSGEVAELGPDVVLLQYVILPATTHILLTTGHARRRPAFGGARKLMVALDGTSRYVPFAALYDGERHLAQRYALALYTDAARGRLKDKPRAGWKVAGHGVTLPLGTQSALPEVHKEMAAIVKRPGNAGVLPGIVKLDESFTAQSLKESLRERFPVVHIASHFTFAPNEKQSSLRLGDGSQLSLDAIRKNYSFAGVELITLSACETAVGGGANGREIEGLGVLAQNQGAKGVIATLWEVNDQSTALLMREFYRRYE